MWSNKTKDTCRRIIRILMVVIGMFLLLVALGIPVINNAIALGVEKELKAHPLPADTQLIESTSLAGKLMGNGNGMQYFGGILVKTERTTEELLSHYGGDSSQLFRSVWVIPYDNMGDDNVARHLPFSTKEGGDGYYIVYRCSSDKRPLQGWLDLDMRGH